MVMANKTGMRGVMANKKGMVKVMVNNKGMRGMLVKKEIEKSLEMLSKYWERDQDTFVETP